MNGQVPGPDASTGAVRTARGDGKVSNKLAPAKGNEFGLFSEMIISVVAPDNAGLPGKLLEMIGSAQINSDAVVEFDPALVEVTVA